MQRVGDIRGTHALDRQKFSFPFMFFLGGLFVLAFSSHHSGRHLKTRTGCRSQEENKPLCLILMQAIGLPSPGKGVLLDIKWPCAPWGLIPKWRGAEISE